MMSGIFHNTNQGDYYTDEETETEESRSNVTATSSGLDKDTKRHVRALDPNESHCIVENVVETQAVEFVHVLPRKLSRKSKLVSCFLYCELVDDLHATDRKSGMVVEYKARDAESRYNKQYMST